MLKKERQTGVDNKGIHFYFVKQFVWINLGSQTKFCMDSFTETCKTIKGFMLTVSFH